MVLLSVSASHRELELDVLERLSLGAGSAVPALVRLSDGDDVVRGAVMLATCNRFEVYLDVADALSACAAVERVRDAVSEASGLPREQVASVLTERTETDAVRHLLEVASGLDSMVVGEREIAGQVRRAIAAAREAGTVTGPLERLFARAQRTSRAVEAGTAISENGRSIIAIALDLAAAHSVPWTAARVVLIGTGSYAGASVAALRARGCADIRVYSTTGRAAQFAAARGVQAIEDGGLVEAIVDADVVLSCRGSIVPVLDASAVVAARTATQRRAERADVVGSLAVAHEPARPLVVVDLALHRDIDPSVAAVDGVLLLDLATIRANVPPAAAGEVERARAIVEEAVAVHAAARAERSVDAVITQVRAQVFGILDAEIERLPSRELTHADAERALRRLAATLAHLPTKAAREAGRSGRGEEYAAAVRLLLGADED